MKQLLTKQLDSVCDAFFQDRMRWVLWIPVFIAIGIALYFLLKEEPPVALVATLPFSLLGTFLVFRKFAVRYIALCLFLVALGFSAAYVRAHYMYTPMISKETGAVRVEGIVDYAENTARGKRFVVIPATIDRIDAEKLPKKIRVTRNSRTDTTQIGDRVTFLAVLRPPPPPVLPGAYDFARYAYFKEIGAVGFVVSEITLIERKETGSFFMWIEVLRETISERIRNVLLERTTAETASALLVGKQNGIPEKTMEAIRASGLAHLLAISGLHLVMVTAMLFFSIRAVLALMPSVAVRYPIKKWAAVGALIGAGFYLLISGMPASAERAFFMSALILLAIMIDRIPMPMRSIALAATVILILQPESLLGPSFQMSFAAATALVALYEKNIGIQDKEYLIREHPSWWKRVGRNIGGTAVASMVAGLATAPFALYHFHQYQIYSVFANVVAVPLTTFIVMPLGMIGLLLMPFGLESLALVPMGWGINAMIKIAEHTASWPWAVQTIPAIPMPALALLTLGMLWYVLWQERWRRWGVALCLAGIGVAVISYRVPDMLVRIEDGIPFIAVKSTSGNLVAVAGKASGYVKGTWEEYYGLEARPEEGLPNFRCDGRGCIYRAGEGSIAVTDERAAVAEDCGVVTALVYTGFVRLPRNFSCGKTEIIPRYRLAKGTHSIMLDEKGVRVLDVAAVRGNRPWTLDWEKQ